MKVGFWIWDFHVFETEVQMIMGLIGKRRKEREMTRGKEGKL